MWVNMKMLFMFCALLALKFGFCTEELKFEIKTVTAGQNVTLSCPCQTTALYQETFYWIRLVSGNWPEFLGATFNFVDNNVFKIPHIQTKRDGGEFLLHISEAKRNDTGLYYCIKVKQLEFRFMNGTFLKIKGPESDISAIIQEPSSGPVHPKNPETLQCLVLSDSEESTCLTDNRVYWFRAGPDDSHPSLLYSGDECERSSEAPSAKKCFYNFSETFDAGTYFCAVTACGQILFGNGTKLEGSNSQKFPNIFLIMLCTALVISLVVISWLIFKIKKKKCGCCNGPARNTGDTQSQQREENTLIYSAPMFNNAKKEENRHIKAAQEETVYTDVKMFR